MLVKLKDPTKVYYCREQRLSLAGEKDIETKATQHVRQLLNQGVLMEVSKVSDEAKAAIIAEAKKEEADKKEADRVAKLTPDEKSAETKAAKLAATKATEKTERA